MPKLYAELYNRTSTFLGLTEAQWEGLQEHFSYQTEGFFHSPLYKRRVWDGFKHWVNRNGGVPTGLLIAKRKELKDAGIRVLYDDLRRPVKMAKKPEECSVPGKTVKPYQLEAVQAMVDSISGGLILNATGTGKTFIVGLYFQAVAEPCLFIVDELTLLDQARAELASVVGEPIGIVGRSEFEVQRCTVATIQTLALHQKKAAYQRWFQSLGATVVDELHMHLNKRTRSVLATIKSKAVFGCTATLNMEDPQVSYTAMGFAGPVLYTYKYSTAVREGNLTPGVVMGTNLVRTHPSKAAVSSRDLYLSAVVHNETRNEIIRSLVEEGVGRGYRILVLVHRIPHIHEMTRTLQGFNHEVVYGAKKSKDRSRSKRRFEKGKIDVLLANGVFKKGISINNIDVIIDGAGLPNQNDAVQKFGRGVRLCEGKRGLIYFDIGERSPKNVAAHHNRFAEATKSRRRALAALGIPVLEVRARAGAATLYEMAEAELKCLTSGNPV